jgi:hypothetical protein
MELLRVRGVGRDRPDKPFGSFGASESELEGFVLASTLSSWLSKETDRVNCLKVAGNGSDCPAGLGCIPVPAGPASWTNVYGCLLGFNLSMLAHT